MDALPQLEHRMTVAEFLLWEPGDGKKWQLVDGYPVAMSPPGTTHAAIQGEVGALLRNHLASHRADCRVLVGPGVLPVIDGEENVRIPDLAVSCGPRNRDELLQDPVLLVEILSPSNPIETWRNVWAFPTIVSVQEILVLRSDRVKAQVLRRQNDGSWPVDVSCIEDGDLTLSSIGLTVSLLDLYRTTDLAAE